MAQQDQTPRQHRIGFALEVDDDGWPPVSAEWLWAEEDENDKTRFCLRNIPFFYRGIALGDQVSANRDDDDNLWFDELHAASGNSTLRVICDPQNVPLLMSRLEAIGCGSEASHIPNLVAVNVPPGVALKTVRNQITTTPGFVEYEEGCIARP